jgi:ribosomal protein L22
MSAEEETGGQEPQDAHAPAEPDAKASDATPGDAETAPASEKKATSKKAPAEKKPAARKKAAAQDKPVAEKAGATEAESPHDQPPAEQKASATKKRAAKKAASEKAAAPGDAEEAKELAKAQESDKPARKVARRASASAKATPRRRVVRARARYVRTSARKARMVCGHIRGKSVDEARAILAFTPREVARDWSKLLESAVANAESNHELLEDDLIVREAYADEGPTIKRFRPRAMGRATPILKRTSHLTLALVPRPQPASNNGKRRKDRD